MKSPSTFQNYNQKNGLAKKMVLTEEAQELPKDVQTYFDFVGTLMLTVMSFDLLHR